MSTFPDVSRVEFNSSMVSKGIIFTDAPILILCLLTEAFLDRLTLRVYETYNEASFLSVHIRDLNIALVLEDSAACCIDRSYATISEEL